MGILIFTLLAIVFGIGSKARKDRKQREKRLQQGSIPANKSLFRPAEMPFEPVKPPFEPEATVSDTFWDVPEESLEPLETEQDTLVSEPETLPEPPKTRKA
ncbi:MAG: hypothetical protein K2I87_01990, partial [Bacteroidales bacterium]|nr:hypothetical protein [Bacteroidales bacterium]